MTRNKVISIVLSVINIIVGFYILIESFKRLQNGLELFYFDNYLNGSLRILPFLLAISMILVSGPLFFKRSTKYLLHTYINSFLFILFYSPSLFYRDFRDSILFYIVIAQFLSIILSIVLLFSKPDKETSLKSQNIKTKITYEEYKDSLNKMKAYKENEIEIVEKKTFLDSLKSYLTFKVDKKNKKQIIDDEDEMIRESSDLNNSRTKEDSYKNTYENKLDSNEDLSYLDSKRLAKNNDNDSELKYSGSKYRQEEHEEIKLPKNHGKKGLRIQDSNVSLTDDDVKIIEDKNDLKEIINNN